MGIVIDKALTIDGSGYTIDANSSARIFNVTADNVVIKNVVFTNGYCKDGTGQAGCVLWSGDNGQLINSTFTDSYAKIGGAVLWYGIDGLIDGCKFISNEAMSTAGAVYWNTTRGNINNSYFSKNHVTTKGGAVYSSYNNDLNITNCDFDSNYASLGAGAIAFDYVSANLVNCSFEDNYAGLSYGFLTFYNNGGAVYLTGNESNLVSLIDCTFEGNNAGEGSGIVGTSLYTTCPVNISDSKFADSSNAKTIATTSEIYLSGNTLDNNNTVYVNGGIVTSPTTVVILNGSSIEGSVGDEITLSGVIYDDNNNSIILQSIDFVVNDDEAVSATFDSYGVFTADYTISEEGSYTVSANVTDKLADAAIMPASITTDKWVDITVNVLYAVEPIAVVNISSNVQPKHNQKGKIHRNHKLCWRRYIRFSKQIRKNNN